MTKVSVSKLKANLSRYLQEVRRGGEVEILDRGLPIARLTALSTSAGGPERRERLSRAGILRQGAGGASSILEIEPLELPTSILAALEEERSERV